MAAEKTYKEVVEAWVRALRTQFEEENTQGLKLGRHCEQVIEEFSKKRGEAVRVRLIEYIEEAGLKEEDTAIIEAFIYPGLLAAQALTQLLRVVVNIDNLLSDEDLESRKKLLASLEKEIKEVNEKFDDLAERKKNLDKFNDKLNKVFLEMHRAEAAEKNFKEPWKSATALFYVFGFAILIWTVHMGLWMVALLIASMSVVIVSAGLQEAKAYRVKCITDLTSVGHNISDLGEIIETMEEDLRTFFPRLDLSDVKMIVDEATGQTRLIEASELEALEAQAKAAEEGEEGSDDEEEMI